MHATSGSRLSRPSPRAGASSSPPACSGSITNVPGGGLLELKLADIIDMAEDREGVSGMTLDDLNPDVGKGVDGVLTPHLRTTGLTLNVVMEYSNRQPGLNLDFTHDVDVEVKVQVPNKLWTSTGPKTTYVVPPYGTAVGKYYHVSAHGFQPAGLSLQLPLLCSLLRVAHSNPVPRSASSTTRRTSTSTSRTLATRSRWTSTT